MAGTKTIYNSPLLECVLELLWRTMGVRIDLTSATANVVAVDGEYSKLVVTALPVAFDGGPAIYSGQSEFMYRKMDLNSLLPHDLVYDGEYPVTFERLQQFMFFSYGFVLDSNEFTLVGGIGTALKLGDTISLAANSNGQIVLSASNASGRWLAGGLIKLTLAAFDP